MLAQEGRGLQPSAPRDGATAVSLPGALAGVAGCAGGWTRSLAAGVCSLGAGVRQGSPRLGRGQKAPASTRTPTPNITNTKNSTESNTNTNTNINTNTRIPTGVAPALPEMKPGTESLSRRVRAEGELPQE